MNDYSILEQTAGKYGAVVLKNEPMKNHTSFRIGGPCDVMIKINCEALLCELIKQRQHETNNSLTEANHIKIGRAHV